MQNEKIDTMERLDKGHIHPKLEVPKLTCLSLESNPGFPGRRRALYSKELFKQFGNSYAIPYTYI